MLVPFEIPEEQELNEQYQEAIARDDWRDEKFKKVNPLRKGVSYSVTIQTQH